ncbi:MAG: hypothetical protein K5765_07900 [Clostridia bacterium]|nr:hypothetical protein [Clostridia bacterium]
MRCSHCGAIINTKTDKCPICDAPINSTGFQAFPKGIHHKAPTKYAYILVIFFGIIDISALVYNIIYHPQFLWSVIQIVSTIYLLFIATLIFRGGRRRYYIGINVSAIILTILFLVLRLTIKGNHWILITWLPVVFLVSEIIMSVYTMMNANNASTFIVARLFLHVLGLFPIIAAYIFDLSVKIPCIVTSCVCFVALIVSIGLNIKNLKKDFIRFFSHK